MWGEIKLPIAYEILDAAIAHYLPGPSTSWVEFTREQISSGSAAYKLWQRLLGDLGKIEIWKVSATESTMLIERPEYPRRSPTPEEMKPLRAIEEKEDYYRALVALNREIEAESHALYLRRVEHQEKVTKTMFSRMATDPCGLRIEAPKGRGGASRLEDREDWPEKQKEARKYLDMVKKGVKSREAAQLIGCDPKTVRGWIKRMKDLGTL